MKTFLLYILRVSATPALPFFALPVSYLLREKYFAVLCEMFRETWAPIALTRAINEAEVHSRTVSGVNERFAADQDWVRVAPFGEHRNAVGLQVLDRASGEAMVKAFNSLVTKAATLFRGLPIYVGHPDDPGWRKANPELVARYGTEAYGRVKELQLRDDGPYARVAWNERGKALIGGEAAPFEAQSPHWGMAPIDHKGRKAFRPMELLSLGLTNNPNIPGTQIGLNEVDEAAAQKPMKEILIKILAALGKSAPANATDEQLVAAANEALLVVPALVTASNEIAGVRTQLTAASNEVKSLTGQLATANGLVKNLGDARVELVLTSAVNEGRITQAQRPEWLGKFGAQGAVFETVQADLHKLTKAVNTKSKVVGLGLRKAEEAASADRVTAINEAVNKHIKDNGLDPARERQVAYDAVQKAKPELFTVETAAE